MMNLKKDAAPRLDSLNPVGDDGLPHTDQAFIGQRTHSVRPMMRRPPLAGEFLRLGDLCRSGGLFHRTH